MRKGPYRRYGKGRYSLAEKVMPSPRRLKGYRFVGGAPGFVSMHWVFKRLPKR